ncbi:hypothetical protein [Streptomyces brasiliscabiei]|uniref:hypothetical protein n=1 Tax=Streptomyces brasiliscabiei TaxID=2736302 RepID=UPI001C102B69|nr:hypothetical protein [Streptomyces brasiliscabiei]
MTPDATPERNPFLEAVGRVTLAGAALDASLRGLLGSIAHEPTLLMYANAEGTARLIELCELALTVGTVDGQDVIEIKACLTRARQLKDKRNTVVHSIFAPAEDGDGFEAMKPLRKNIGLSVSAITIAEMEATAESIEDLRSDMFRAGWNVNAKRMGGQLLGHSPTRAPAVVSGRVRTGAIRVNDV